VNYIIVEFLRSQEVHNGQKYEYTVFDPYKLSDKPYFEKAANPFPFLENIYE